MTAITLTSNPSLAALTFSNSSYTFSGSGSLTLSNTARGTATVTVTGGTQTILSAMASRRSPATVSISGNTVLNVSGNICDEPCERIA